MYPRPARGQRRARESYADGWWDTDDPSGFLRLTGAWRAHIVRDRTTAGYDLSSIPSSDGRSDQTARPQRPFHYDQGTSSSNFSTK